MSSGAFRKETTNTGKKLAVCNRCGQAFKRPQKHRLGFGEKMCG